MFSGGGKTKGLGPKYIEKYSPVMDKIVEIKCLQLWRNDLICG